MNPEKAQRGAGMSTTAGPLTQTSSTGVSQSGPAPVASSGTATRSPSTNGSSSATAESAVPAGAPRVNVQNGNASRPAPLASARPSKGPGETVTPPRRPEQQNRPTPGPRPGPGANAQGGPPAQQQQRPAEPVGYDPDYDGHDGGDGVRTVRLTVANVDPMSVLKLSFLVAVAAGIMLVVAVTVLWMLLDRMGVFADINRILADVGGKESTLDVYDYVGFSKVVSLATVVGIVNILIITALSTIFAFLYNFGSGLVGGLHVTLADD